MIALGGGGRSMVNGDPPPECSRDMKVIRYSIIGVFISFVGTMCLRGFPPLGDLLYIIAGIFVCKDDAVLQRWHSCILRTPLRHCGGPTAGGGSCLLPLTTISFVNVLFGMFVLWNPTGVLPFAFVSLACQLYGGYISYRVFDVMKNSVITADYTQPPSQLSAPLQQSLDMRHMSFTPFQGQGQKLGG
eukprot:GEMP01064389.1.p1 GENE.GEMP01064389.1~~GEMP01064389.1.p1  ORF type:complete len:188 (+),score=18.27 GEMP01064389.1:281-844(+)